MPLLAKVASAFGYRFELPPHLRCLCGVNCGSADAPQKHVVVITLLGALPVGTVQNLMHDGNQDLSTEQGVNTWNDAL
jgi:hypothetical protein